MPTRPSVLNPHCGAQEVLDLIADKWTALVIYTLAGRTMRHGEMRKAIGGVSQKMLTQTLRKLERDGLVQRTVFPVVPPHVEYALTPLGMSLLEPLKTLCRWAEDHLGEMMDARARSTE